MQQFTLGSNFTCHHRHPTSRLVSFLTKTKLQDIYTKQIATVISWTNITSLSTNHYDPRKDRGYPGNHLGGLAKTLSVLKITGLKTETLCSAWKAHCFVSTAGLSPVIRRCFATSSLYHSHLGMGMSPLLMVVPSFNFQVTAQLMGRMHSLSSMIITCMYCLYDWARSLYFPFSSYNSQVELHLDILSSMLRLGNKYQIDILYNAALARIRQILPASLLEWSSITQDSSWPKTLLGGQTALNLLRVVLDNGLEEHLPLAYYFCVVCHPKVCPLLLYLVPYLSYVLGSDLRFLFQV